jgi:hypothetical protein
MPTKNPKHVTPNPESQFNAMIINRFSQVAKFSTKRSKAFDQISEKYHQPFGLHPHIRSIHAVDQKPSTTW